MVYSGMDATEAREATEARKWGALADTLDAALAEALDTLAYLDGEPEANFNLGLDDLEL